MAAAQDWDSRAVWIHAQVSRAILSQDGRHWTVQAWAQWQDGTYGTFSAEFPDDPRLRPGDVVAVQVDPLHRLTKYRIVVDPGPAVIDPGFARPVDEPALASNLIGMFGGGVGPPAPRGGPVRAGPPRLADTGQLPVPLACMSAAFVLAIAWLFWRSGHPVSQVIAVAAVVGAVALVTVTVAKPWAAARLRRNGVRIPATVTDIRQRSVRVMRAGRLPWEVVATATGPDGTRLTLLSDPLRDDPGPWCPVGSQVTALVDPAHPDRCRLLLDRVTPAGRSDAAGA